MEPWTRPIFDIFEEYWSPRDIARMLDDRVIEISPLAYMRGRTFKNCYIVADEMQNATEEQMKMLLTRIGYGTNLSVTGDLQQHDRGFVNNGLKDFLNRLNNSKASGIAICKFETAHVERDQIVAQVLSVYDSAD
jgi:phosphate starvation-inducible PhoH-like protein